MRQVAGLLVVIQKSDLIEYYISASSYRYSKQKELPSLDEFLSLSLKQGAEVHSPFDETTDKMLEAHALKRLSERQKAHG